MKGVDESKLSPHAKEVLDLMRDGHTVTIDNKYQHRVDSSDRLVVTKTRDEKGEELPLSRVFFPDTDNSTIERLAERVPEGLARLARFAAQLKQRAREDS